MDRLENVATPATAAADVVPESAPPPGLVPMATVMVAVELVTVLPNVSCTATCTDGLIDAPATTFAGCTVKATFAAAAGLMVNAVELAPVSAPDAAVSVYPAPVLSMERLENVATPLTAATVVVPESAPPPGLVPIATVMLAVELVTVLLNASCTVTCTAGAIATPAIALDGWTVNATLAAAAGLTLNAELDAPESAPDAAVRVYPTPALSIERLAKLATPFTAATVATPESVPPPGLVPIATVTLAEELVTVLPNASCTATWTAGEMAAPAMVVVGCTVNATLLAAAGVMLNAADVAPVSGADAAVSV